MTPSYIPTPGWLALRLGRYGHAPLLSVMAAGQLEAQHLAAARGKPFGPDEAIPFFANLAADDEPGWALQQYWGIAAERYPYLAGHLGPLTDWLVDAPPERLEGIRAIAGTLADVDIYGLSRTCDTGVLATVHNELVAIAARRSNPVDFMTLRAHSVFAVQMQLLTGHVITEGSSIGDLACGGGGRLQGAVVAAACLDVDPTTIHFYAADFDPMAVAVTGINLASYQLPNVHLSSDLRTAEWEGAIDLMLMDLTEFGDRLAVEMGIPEPDLDFVLEVVDRESVREVLYNYQQAVIEARTPPPAPRPAACKRKKAGRR